VPGPAFQPGHDPHRPTAPRHRPDDALESATVGEWTVGQADQIRSGVSLRDQVRFDAYLAARQQKPSLTFRDHLRTVGGEIEV
jgi:hypothetical protein